MTAMCCGNWAICRGVLLHPNTSQSICLPARSLASASKCCGSDHVLDTVVVILLSYFCSTYLLFPVFSFYAAACRGRCLRQRRRRRDPHPPLDPPGPKPMGGSERRRSLPLSLQRLCFCQCHVLISSSRCSRPETFLAQSFFSSLFEGRKQMDQGGEECGSLHIGHSRRYLLVPYRQRFSAFCLITVKHI